KRYEEIQIYLVDAKIITDQERFRTLSKEYAQLTNITKYFKLWCAIQEDIEKAEILLHDPEIKEIAQEELEKAEKYNKEIEQKLEILLLPKDLDDEKNCFLEIRAGTGGNEAAIFAGDLFRMYNRYAESRYWHIEIMNVSEGEHGG
ncbi:MAG: PCRF domain-containing protein, partial [Arsenophonus sp. ET-DL12-MAG3]